MLLNVPLIVSRVLNPSFPSLISKLGGLIFSNSLGLEKHLCSDGIKPSAIVNAHVNVNVNVHLRNALEKTLEEDKFNHPLQDPAPGGLLYLRLMIE